VLEEVMAVRSIHPRAGTPAEAGDLVNLSELTAAYFDRRPDPGDPAQRVSFGTSGHRGSSLDSSFNEDHLAAVCQAICEYRAQAGITGPLFLGRDTHALSELALTTAIEVFAANDVRILLDARAGYTPTPAVSHAILRHNRGGPAAQADGVVITPSHNPPRDGGIKYNPPDGGPSDSTVTTVIQARANELIEAGLHGVRRIPEAVARRADTTGSYDFLDGYVGDLPSVVDLEAIAGSGVRIGVDPLGGASAEYWAEIAARFRFDLTVVNTAIDPTWSFMTLDWDGKIRMDCSSAFAMASLVNQREAFDVALGNDADADRHGIVTPDAGLMAANQYLAVAIDYLFRHRPQWSPASAVGKTIVSSSMIDFVAKDLGRSVVEVPVGFKWFVQGLVDGSLGFAGEESAGAAFARRDGQVWTTDKDGIVLCLLAAEIMAVTGQSPSTHYRALEQRHGSPAFARIDAPASASQRDVLSKLSADRLHATSLAGDPIDSVLVRAPGNDAPIGGVKVISRSGWFAARPSGTEDLYKIYAESFDGPDHLERIQDDAVRIVGEAFQKVTA
jgi:phosphoglucomutase